MASEQVMEGARSALTVDIDELGAFARVSADSTVYDRAAIFKAAYWFTERLYLFLSRGSTPLEIQIEIRPKREMDREALEASARDFCNAIIDYQVRQKVIAETAEIRDTLLRKAFGEGRKHLRPDNLVSDESHVPGGGESYRDDPHDIGHLTGEKLPHVRRARD